MFRGNLNYNVFGPLVSRNNKGKGKGKVKGFS